jgi:hypothetical protein
MKALRILRALLSALVPCLFLYCSAQAQPVLVTNAPAAGTFYLMSVNPSLPFPFDPYFGALPIYTYDGVFFVDDSQVGDLLLQEGGGGGMMLNSISPGSGSGSGLAGSNSCLGPALFDVTYQLSTTNEVPYGTNLWLQIAVGTNAVALTIHTPNTNAYYDIFGTTNLSPYVAPLNLTNWLWLKRAGGPTNFLWTNIVHCAGAWFQLGTMDDYDLDSLTSAYETLVSHTSTNLWDTDGDLIGDGIEVLFGLNPRVTDPPFTITITQPNP